MKQSAFLTLFLAVIMTACQPTPMATSNEPPIDFAAALEKAKTENKLILLEFTGSDWCPPCIQMHENIFSKPEFKEFAKANLIFLVADFPNDIQQSDEQKKINEELAKKFDVEAFPTFVLLNSQGKEVWREVGAFAKSPAEFISAIDAARKNPATTAPKKS